MMRTTIGITVVLLAGVVAGVSSRAAAQMSSPNYSTYNDGEYGGDGYVYGWSSVDDYVPQGCDHSNYNTTTYLTSPTGRYASLESGGTSSNVAMEYDGEVGYWDVGTEGYLFCSCAGTDLYYSGESPLTLDVCAVPTNFRETSRRVLSTLPVLEFNYAWGSSTGQLSDLQPCSTGEQLADTPNPWPSPPFNADTPGYSNPYFKTFAGGSQGYFSDDHWTGGFTFPLRAASVTTTQSYWYSCPCNGGAKITMSGAPWPVQRDVIQNPNGSFKYQVSKQGLSTTKDPIQ